MSITFGVYDFFSYTVPGFLYIWTINQSLAIFKLPHFSVEDITLDIGFALIGIVAAYVVGGLMDVLAYRWYLLFYRNKIEKQSLDNLKSYYPELEVNFEIKDRRLLFSFVKHDHLELAENIDKFKALNIMFHNVSFGLFLFSLVQITMLFIGGFSLTGLVFVVAAWVFSYISLKRSALFNLWYWYGNFEQALHYGNDIPTMFRKKWTDQNLTEKLEKVENIPNDAEE